MGFRLMRLGEVKHNVFPAEKDQFDICVLE